MATIAEMLRRVKALHLETETKRIINQTRPEMVKLQQQQLYIGRNSENEPIRPGYTPMTKRLKLEKKQPIDRVTLKDTGSFYKKIRITGVTAEKFDWEDSDPKTDDLIAKYGKDIFGLDLPSRIQYVDEHFFPALKEYIETTTKLKME